MTVAPLDALSEAEARRLTERIRYTAMSVRDGVAKLQEYVAQAQEGQAHVALGYASWTAYLADVLGEEPMRLPRDKRREVVAWLSGEGMSTRAIAPIVGVDHATAARDLAPVANATPAAGPVDETEPAPTPEPGTYPQARRATWPERVDRRTGEIHDETPTKAVAAADDAAQAEPGPRVEASPSPPPRGPVTGLDGKKYKHPKPGSPRRPPLFDQFMSATTDLGRVINRLSRLSEDDRLPQNRDEVATANRSDLVRAIDALQRVLASLD